MLQLHYTRGLLLFLTITTLSFSLVSCSSFKLNSFIKDDNQVADERFQKIIDALESNDKEGLKKMFSPKELEDAKDIDGGIDYIMNFYKGNMTSRDEGTIPSSSSSEDGERKKELDCKYIVTTDKDTYIVFFIDKTVDTKNPDNVGIYMLQIIKESDKDKYFDWGKVNLSVLVFLDLITTK